MQCSCLMKFIGFSLFQNVLLFWVLNYLSCYKDGLWADPQIGAQFGQINNNCDQIGSNVQDASNSNNTASATDESPDNTTTTMNPPESRQQINSPE